MRFGVGSNCLIAVLSLVAATAVHSNPRPDRRAALPVVVDLSPPDTCRIEFAGQTFDLARDQEKTAAALRRLRKDWCSVSISGVVNTPYRCLGQAVYLMQRSGFKKVGFVGEPPDR